jgi:hypothetical protein
MHHVVVTRYNEDTSWTRDIDKSNLFIYDKSPEPLTDAIAVPNVGRENETMLRHIIEHYDKLPEYIIFLQGDPWVHMERKGGIKDIITEHVNRNPHLVEPFDRDCVIEDVCAYPNIHLISTCSKIFAKPFGAVIYSPGAQCIVSRNAILHRPIEFYKKLRDLIVLQGNQTWLGYSAEPPCDPNLMNSWVMERITIHIFDPAVDVNSAFFTS